MILKFFYSAWPHRRSCSWALGRRLSKCGVGAFPSHLAWSWSTTWAVSTFRTDRIR